MIYIPNASTTARPRLLFPLAITRASHTPLPPSSTLDRPLMTPINAEFLTNPLEVKRRVCGFFSSGGKWVSQLKKLAVTIATVTSYTEFGYKAFHRKSLFSQTLYSIELSRPVNGCSPVEPTDAEVCSACRDPDQLFRGGARKYVALALSHPSPPHRRPPFWRAKGQRTQSLAGQDMPWSSG